PEAMIIAKTLYGFLLLLFLGFAGLGFYSLVLGNPIQDLGLYSLGLFIAILGFSVILTLVSAIASKAQNNGTLMAILSFPVLIPLLLLAIKLSKNAMDGLDWSVSLDEIYTLLAIDAIVMAISYILFPFLWRN
ncbi:MAG: ABC transporter permease, partial [Bacteroidetes bacterium]